MSKLIRTIVVFLMFKIDWRKLFLVCSIFTIGSVLIQISSLPYPLTDWISPPNIAISSYKPLNSAIHLGHSHPLAVGLPLETVQDAPRVFSLNPSVTLNQSTVITKRERRLSRRRKGRNRVKSSTLVPPSPPHIIRNIPNQLKVIPSLLTLLFF